MPPGLWNPDLRTLRDRVRLVPRNLNTTSKLSGWQMGRETCGRMMVVILMNFTNTTSDE